MKLKPVLLETKDESRICYLTAKGKEFRDLRLIDIPIPQFLDSINYHLILISTSDINDLDWKYNLTLKTCWQQNRSHIPVEYQTIHHKDTYKIEVSTNEIHKLPTLTDESLQLIIDFINKYDRLPEFVEVTSEQYFEDYHGNETNVKRDICYTKNRINSNKIEVTNLIH